MSDTYSGLPSMRIVAANARWRWSGGAWPGVRLYVQGADAIDEDAGERGAVEADADSCVALDPWILRGADEGCAPALRRTAIDGHSRFDIRHQVRPDQEQDGEDV